MTENQLITGCRNNDRVAQQHVYNLYASKVMTVCLRYSNSKEDAKDIFQDAFINIFKSLERSNTVETLGAWIRKVAANTAINYYYKNRKHNDRVSIKDLYEFTHHNALDSTQQNALSQLDEQDLLALIDILPIGCKHVFNLYAVEGYAHHEIAKLMNISEGTSKSQLSRARSIMKARLNEQNQVKYKKVI